MKKIMVTMLATVLCAALCGCSKNVEGSDTPQGTAGVSNPFVQVSSSAEFETQLGISLPMPTNAGDVICTICNNEFAQIDCVIGADEYYFRAQFDIDGKELSGVHGEWTSIQSAANTLYYTCDSTSVAIFKVGTCCYTITTEADIATLINIAEDYIMLNSFREV